ncbi:hypothetical protein LCGC14_2175030, partial [marine sediment metagenome]
MADEQVKEKSTRRTYRDESWTEEQVKARRAELTREEVPEGYVKVSEVDAACRAAGIPVSKLVRAFGGDRGMSAPAHPLFAFVYVGRTRYLPGKVLTEGLEMLASPEFLKTVRKRKPKAKAAEGTGPVKKAQKKTKV